MREFSKIDPKFWIGETGRMVKQEGPEALIVCLYLLTSPHSNMLGVYYCPLVIISHETGLPLKGASKGLQRAIAQGFCKYDEESEVVWVVNMAWFQVGEGLKPNDNRVKGINKDYQNLPKCSFIGEFFDLYQNMFHLTGRRGGEGALKPLQSKETEIETEIETETLSSSPVGEAPSGKIDVCPHKKIISLYAEVLPELPQVDLGSWSGSDREKALRQRWREQPERQNLDWWRELFTRVKASDFLMGRKKDFRADLGWLIKKSNFVKVLEGNYVNRGVVGEKVNGGCCSCTYNQRERCRNLIKPPRPDFDPARCSSYMAV